MTSVPIEDHPLPMLASEGPLPIDRAQWSYEFKWDGIRVIAQVAGGQTRLWGRRGNEITVAYPELAVLGAGLPDAIFDGELVALVDGRPSFERLAHRIHVRDPHRAAQLAAQIPATFMIFDVLRLGGVDLTRRPHHERRELLEQLDLHSDRWLVPPRFDDGPATLAVSDAHGLEGVVAKRRDSVYRPGARSPDWIKIKHQRTVDVIVGGWRPGVRPLGALLVGERTDEGLAYRGRVGGGLSGQAITQLLSALEPLRAAASPFHGELPRDDARGAIWVRPELIVEVRYGNRTADGRLRFPRFVRRRLDLEEGA